MIVIYDDKGVSQQSLQAFRAYFSEKHEVCCLSGREIQSTQWMNEATLFIMPGGRSLPFYEALGSAGNQAIVDFVTHGGCYLGVCAGAYYAVRETLFALDLPHELRLPGALNFFEGQAVGPVFSAPAFDYQAESGACVVTIAWGEEQYPSYFNGGCAFTESPFTIARYAENHLPAMIAFSYGKGRVVLSGVHPELDAGSIPIDDNPHHSLLRENLIKFNTKRRELLVKLVQQCYPSSVF